MFCSEPPILEESGNSWTGALNGMLPAKQMEKSLFPSR